MDDKIIDIKGLGTVKVDGLMSFSINSVKDSQGNNLEYTNEQEREMIGKMNDPEEGYRLAPERHQYASAILFNLQPHLHNILSRLDATEFNNLEWSDKKGSYELMILKKD